MAKLMKNPSGKVVPVAEKYMRTRVAEGFTPATDEEVAAYKVGAPPKRAAKSEEESGEEATEEEAAKASSSSRSRSRRKS